MELSMRNILARHSAMAVVLAVVVAMPFAAAAADLFWYGTAGVMGLAVKIVGSPSGLAIFVR